MKSFYGGLSLAFLGLLAIGWYCWMEFGRSSTPVNSQRQYVSSTSDSAGDADIAATFESLRTFRMYCEVHSRLLILNGAALTWHSQYFAYAPLPDGFESRSRRHQERIRSVLGMEKGYKYRHWGNGDSVRLAFVGGDNTMSDLRMSCVLSDEEFTSFITDPFDPAHGQFQYTLVATRSTEKKSKILPITSSVGPDGIRDIVLSHLDTELPNFGLGSDLVDRMYDPTNGAVSRGDIVGWGSPAFPGESFLRYALNQDATMDYF